MKRILTILLSFIFAISGFFFSYDSTMALLNSSFEDPFQQYSSVNFVYEGELCGDVNQNALRGGAYYQCVSGFSCDFFESKTKHVLEPSGRCVVDERFMCESTGGVVYDNMSCNCPLEEEGGCDGDIIRVTHESTYDDIRDELNVEITARNTTRNTVTWSEFRSGCGPINEDTFGVRIRLAAPPFALSPSPNPKEVYLVGSEGEFYEFSDTSEYYMPGGSATCDAMIKNTFHFGPSEIKKASITIPGSVLPAVAYIVETKYGGSFQYTSDGLHAYKIVCSGGEKMVNGKCNVPEPIVRLSSYQDLHDIKGHWGESYIRDLLVKGVVDGYKNRFFYPDRSITRAEFIKIILLSLDYTIANQPTSQQSFYDVRIGDWYSDYIYTAALRGVIEGYTDGTFRPDERITRAEAVAVAMRASRLEAYGYSHSFFYDVHKLWQKQYIESAYRLNLINGKSGGRFDPEGLLTRAEASKIVSNILNLSPSNVSEQKPFILETNDLWPR